MKIMFCRNIVQPLMVHVGVSNGPSQPPEHMLDQSYCFGAQCLSRCYVVIGDQARESNTLR